MFGTITNSLVKQVGGDVLIAVPRPLDSKKLKPLTVVRKRPAVWFWQKTKYRPTEFTLNDLLVGEPIQPVLEKTEFLKYNEKQIGLVDGSVEAGLVGVNFTSYGYGTSEFSSPFGMLHKEVVNMQRLLQDSKNRMMDLDHGLIQQAFGKHKLAFSIVIERILTTRECNIEYKGVKEGGCSAMLHTLGIYPLEVCLKESASLQRDTNVDMTILPETVLAYSVISLDIRSDGHYKLAVLSDGFESDSEVANSSFYDEDIIDGLIDFTEICKGSSLNVLKKDLSKAKAILCELTNLPAQSRSSILLLFRQILPNRTLLYTLEDKLKDIGLMLQVDEAPCLSQKSKSDIIIENFLDLLQSQRTSTNGLSTSHLNHDENGDSEKSTKPVLTAMHMLISAAEGLTDDGLILLDSLCSSDVLSALKDLVNLLTEHSQPLPIDSLPTPLQNEDVFKKVEKLFSSSKVILKRERTFWAEAESSSEHLPLVLCIAILGLACLNEA